MRNLNLYDLLAILFVWTGAVSIAYFSIDSVVIIACIVAAYYLSKWIILKRQDKPEDPPNQE